MFNYDSFGPEKVVQIFNPKLGFKAFLVIDNTAFGPGKGGIVFGKIRRKIGKGIFFRPN